MIDDEEYFFGECPTCGQRYHAKQSVPISDDRIRQVWNKTQDPIATVRTMLAEAVHPSPAPQAEAAAPVANWKPMLAEALAAPQEPFADGGVKQFVEDMRDAAPQEQPAKEAP